MTQMDRTFDCDWNCFDIVESRRGERKGEKVGVGWVGVGGKRGREESSELRLVSSNFCSEEPLDGADP